MNTQTYRDEWVTAVLTRKIGALQLSIEEYPGLKVNSSSHQMLTNILIKAYNLLDNKESLPSGDKALVKMKCKLSSLLTQQ